MEQQNLAFENVLQKINNYITLKSTDRMKYSEDFHELIFAIITALRNEDPVFDALYNGPRLAGSTADNLKVTLPDEYDLVLRMKLRETRLVKVERVKKIPGYVKIDLTDVLNLIKNQKQNELIYKKLLTLVDKDSKLLLQNKFQQWIESILTKVLIKNQYQFKTRNNRTYRVNYSKTGPAHTIKLTYEGRFISIDLVPAIVFDKSKWIAARQPPIGAETNWIAVPKPNKSLQAGTNNIAFQTSYVDTERYYIKNKYNFKNTLRMIKKLRDRHNIHNLKSYFIKTVFLWENLNPNLGPNFWNTSAAKILLYMLEKVEEYVAKGSIPFFWNQGENMLGNLSQAQLKAMTDQISKIRRLIIKYSTTDTSKIYDLFLTRDEINDMQRQQSTNRIENSDIEDMKLLTSPEDTPSRCVLM